MSDTALATIAERDRRIATLAKQLLSNEKSLIDADSRIAELEKEGERLEKEKWSLTNSRDTATRELAEAKAERDDTQKVKDVLFGQLKEARAEIARYVDMSGRFANEVAQLRSERDQLKADNEKLRATVAAQQTSLGELIKLAEVWTPEFTAVIHRARMAWSDTELAKGTQP